MKTTSTWSLVVLVGFLASAPAPARADSWNGAPTRPQGFSVGIGAGWHLPADIQTLNTFGVRFRFPGGLSLEPRVQASSASSIYDVGGIETESTQKLVSAMVNLRHPVVRRGRADFVLVGGAAYGWSKDDTWDSDYTSTSQSFSLVWGIAIDYWIGTHWSLSANATNPLLSVVQQTDEHNDTETSSTSFGAFFSPSVVAMIHLFY